MTNAETETIDTRGGETLGTPWKRLLFCSVLPFLVFLMLFVLICRNVDSHNHPFCFFIAVIINALLFIRMLCQVVFVCLVCARRYAIRKKHPSMSLLELNEAAYRKYVEDSIAMQRKTNAWSSSGGTCDGPEKVNNYLWAYWRLIDRFGYGFYKKYFSIRQEVLEECSKKELEARYPNGVEITSFDIFEKVSVYMNSVEFKNVMDFITFRKFFVSGMIMWMWILASAIDIYVFFKYLSDMKESAFIVLLLLSLIAIRVACEYTIVLFSIADLTREVRDEMHKSNALKMKKQGIKDDSEEQS